MEVSDTFIALICEEAELRCRLDEFIELRDKYEDDRTPAGAVMWKLGYDLVDCTLVRLDEVNNEILIQEGKEGRAKGEPCETK